MGGGQSPSIQQPKPVRMPNPNDPSVVAARKRLLDKALGRSGRGSTILSDALRLNGSQGALGA